MKKIFMVLLITLLLAPAAFAINGSDEGNSRLTAMGLHNYQTEDISNIWFNPANVVKFKNRMSVLLDGYSIGGTSTTTTTGTNDRTTAWGGIDYGTDYGVLGLWLGRPVDSIIGDMDSSVSATSMGSLSSFTSTGVSSALSLPALAVSNPDRNIDFLYGLDVGPLLVGIRLNANSKNSDTRHSKKEDRPLSTTNTTNYSASTSLLENRSDWGLHLGVAMKDIPITASFLIGFPSMEYTSKLNDSLRTYETPTTNKEDSAKLTDSIEGDASSFGFYTNAQVKMSDTVTLIPTFFYESRKNDSTRSFSKSSTIQNFGAGTTLLSTDTTTFNGNSERGDSRSDLGIDAAFNMKPNDKTLIVTAVGLGSSSSEKTLTKKITEDKTVNTTTAGVTTTTYNTLTTAYGEYGNASEKTSVFNIPLAIGLEHKTTEKLTTLLGIKADIYNKTKTEKVDHDYSTAAGTTGITPVTTVTDVKTEDKSVISGTGAATVSMGFAYLIGDSLTLSGVLNQDILFTGSHLISGVPETLFTSVSLAYTF